MKKYQYSVNENIVNKGRPYLDGWHNVETDLDGLADYIRRGIAHSQAVLKMPFPEAKPKKDDVLGCELLFVDIDNTIGNGNNKRRRTEEEYYLSLETTINNKWIKDHAFMVYTTPSHTEDINRFRIVFALPKVYTVEQFETISRPFTKRFHADNCHSAEHLFFGNRKAEVYSFGNTLTQSIIDSVIQESKLEARASKEFEKHKEKYGEGKSQGTITEELAAEMLALIPGEEIEYFQWFKILSAVGNYFDEDTAIRLIDQWSPDEKRGTAYKISKRGSEYNIGSLIYMASLYGFDKSRIYGATAKSDTMIDESGNLVDKDGKPVNKEEPKGKEAAKYLNNKFNVILTIRSYLDMFYELRKNVVKDFTEFREKNTESDWQLLEQDMENKIWADMNVNWKIPRGSFDSVLDSPSVQRYHPIKEYFDKLPEWDAEKYPEAILDVARLVKVAPDQEEMWLKYFTKWVVATVATGLERGENHTCLVLVGGQGIGKTTFLRKLAPKELQKGYYVETQINPADKDTKVMVSENFIINLDELESSNRDEIGHLKSLLTTPYVTVRKAYARRSQPYKRRASFVGSVNKAMFLTDITGSRRFLTIEALDIDLKTEVNIEQMYAQALDLLDNGFQYWFNKKEIEAINDANKRYQVACPEEDLILDNYVPFEIEGWSNEDLFRKHDNENDPLFLMSSTSITNELSHTTLLKLNATRIGQFLTKLGFKQQLMKRDNVVSRKWVLLKKSKMQSGFFDGLDTPNG